MDWELGYKESWALKNWCFWTMVLEKTLGLQGDQPVYPKRNQSWIFIRRTDVEAETPTLWPPNEKSWLIWKDPDAGKDWRQKEKEMTEGEMVGWHHWLNGHEFEWTLGVGNGQGGLSCCSPFGDKESDTTERLKWTELNWIMKFNLYLVFHNLCYFIYLYTMLLKTANVTFYFYSSFEIESDSVNHSVSSDSVTSWTVAHWAPLSIWFSRQRILEWVDIFFSGESSQPTYWTCIPCVSSISRQILYH